MNILQGPSANGPLVNIDLAKAFTQDAGKAAHIGLYAGKPEPKSPGNEQPKVSFQEYMSNAYRSLATKKMLTF